MTSPNFLPPLRKVKVLSVLDLDIPPFAAVSETCLGSMDRSIYVWNYISSAAVLCIMSKMDCYYNFCQSVLCVDYGQL